MTAGPARPTVAANQVAALEPPYRTALKPYGRALVELARRRPEIVCLSGDLTRQCEIDLFQAEIPDRFIHAGMAEANMMGVAGQRETGQVGPPGRPLELRGQSGPN